MDFILVSTEDNDDCYFSRAADLTDAILENAINRLSLNRAFSYLPSASLSAMCPPRESQHGTTIGTLTVFRGGRIQWSAGGMDALAQDWRIPHIYSDAAEAFRLWQALRAGDIAAVTGKVWTAAQVKLCPICGFDLLKLVWQATDASFDGRREESFPPLTVPPYETCGGCATTFGVDWLGSTYGEMRERWLERVCPWWASGRIPEAVRADPLALRAFERLSRDLMKTPTDYPLSSAPGV
jgi:hypothetical protein